MICNLCHPGYTCQWHQTHPGEPHPMKSAREQVAPVVEQKRKVSDPWLRSVDEVQAITRRDDPMTSKRSAARVNAEGGGSKRAQIILALLQENPDGLTVAEICRLSGEPATCISPCMKPLERRVQIRRNGTRQDVVTTHSQTVWQVV